MKRTIAILALCATTAVGETVVWNKTASGRQAIEAVIPAAAITAGDREAGEISLWITAGNGYTGWTWALPSKPGDLYLTDGKEKMPLLNPVNPAWGDLGPTAPGARKELRFALPHWPGTARPSPLGGAAQRPLRLVCKRGVFVWGGNSHGDFTVEIWKGVRVKVEGWVDGANRCGFVDMKDVPATNYVFRVSRGNGGKNAAAPKAVFEQAEPVFRIRMPADGSAVLVEAEAHTAREGVFAQKVVLSPREKPLASPLAPGEVLVGQCVYDGDRRFADEIVTNGLADLIVSWNKLDTLTNMPPAVRREFDRKRMAFMTIYGYDKRRDTYRVRAELGGRYLWNNVGELAGYLYQGPKEAAAVGVPQDSASLKSAKDRFVNVFIERFVRARHKDYGAIFSTSGSPLGCYELQGGMDFMCNELFAVGSANLAYATSEARGAARKWKPEFWGGWLAEEWQTFPVPYSSRQKYDLLKVAMLQQYLMGTSLIVLESGAQSTQAQKYTAGAEGKRQGYNDHAPREYRRAVKEFRDWVAAHPRDPSGPEAKVAFVMGNNDGFVGMSHENFAVWAQHETAATNAAWKCAAPEATWELAKSVAFPVVKDALAPYPNSWLAATPFGQIDVVQMDEEARLSDIARYDALVYAGWNTMTPRIARILAKWVENGGDLLMALPHLATNDTRKLEGIVPGDLVGAGNLEPLVPYKATGREPCAVREFRRGKGRVRLLTAWQYPGAGGKAAELYRKELAAVLSAHRGRAYVSGKDAAAVSYAVYANTVYLLNMDAVKSRTVTLHLPGGRKKEVRLKPGEMAIADLPGAKAPLFSRREPFFSRRDAEASEAQRLFNEKSLCGSAISASLREKKGGAAPGWWHALRPDGGEVGDPKGLCSWLWDIGAFSGGSGVSPLSAAALATVRKTLERARANKAQMVVRFAYTSGADRDSEPDDFETILGHVRQLGGVLGEFPDVVYALECGMVGPWGEMHSSRYLARDQKRRLVEAWGEAMPGTIPILVRNPSFVKAAEGLECVAGRLGMFNDGYLGTDADYGTWVGGADGMTRAEGVQWLESHGGVPYGGEFAYVEPSALEGMTIFDPARHNLVEEFYRTHLSYLRNLDDENLAIVKKLKSLKLTHEYDFPGMPDWGEWYGRDLHSFLKAHLPF